MAWSPKSAARLMTNPDFRDLFEDPGSPLVREMTRLADLALRPAVALDRDRSIRAVCVRAGMADVLRVVRHEADSAAGVTAEPDPQTETSRDWRRAVRPLGRYLPRRLAG